MLDIVALVMIYATYVCLRPNLNVLLCGVPVLFCGVIPWCSMVVGYRLLWCSAVMGAMLCGVCSVVCCGTFGVL